MAKLTKKATKQTSYDKVSDWLGNEIHSHGVYSATMLDQLRDFGIDVQLIGGRDPRARLVYGEAKTEMGLSTIAEVEQQMRSDPRGGEIWGDRDPQQVTFTGYVVSAVLARLLTGESPGASYMGRGFAYRADLEGIRKAGF